MPAPAAALIDQQPPTRPIGDRQLQQFAPRHGRQRQPELPSHVGRSIEPAKTAMPEAEVRLVLWTCAGGPAPDGPAGSLAGSDSAVGHEAYLCEGDAELGEHLGSERVLRTEKPGEHVAVGHRLAMCLVDCVGERELGTGRDAHAA